MSRPMRPARPARPAMPAWATRPRWAHVPAALLGLRGVVWSILTFPARQRRRRLGLQLLADHLLAALLSTVAIYAIVIAVLFGYIGSSLFFGDAWDIDGTMGEKARTIGFALDPDEVVAAADGDPAARTAIRTTLGAMVPDDAASDTAGGPITSPDGEPLGLGDDPPHATLESVDNALVVGLDGTILASTDRGWALPGQAVTSVGFAPLTEAVGKVIAADGGVVAGSMGSPYALGYRDHVTAGAFPIVDGGGNVVGVAAVQGEPFDLSEFISPSDLLRQVLEDEWRSMIAFSVLGLLITLPLVFWRARVVSRRVKALAVAADAWAAGDLTRRAAVSGEDEIGRLGEHFNGMSERLAAADRARRAFVANVSHDLRTPVAIMQGHLERLQRVPATAGAATPAGVAVAAGSAGDDPRTWGSTAAGSGPFGGIGAPSGDPGAARGYGGEGGGIAVDPATLELLHRETVTLARLIDDLFTLARVEETQLPLELGPLDLATTIAEATEGLRQLAWAQSKVTVRSLIRPDLPPVMGDGTRIRQILNNLIFNALRHTPAGGLVIVDGQEVAGGSQIEVSVMDTGVGIPPEKLPSIFERFFQGDEGARSKGEGSGLGLHIVKQLVEAQGGTITVESSLGQGTVFRFRLPRAVARTGGRGGERGRG